MTTPIGRRSLFALALVTAGAACGNRPDSPTLEVGDDCQAAREAERRGDYASARAAYASCLARVPGYVDSHAAYQRILELEDGIESARRTYAELVHANPGVVTSFAQARILARPERTAALERIVAGHPDFAPAYYELSLDQSERILGTQSLSAKSREKLYLEAFLLRASGPEFVRYFADYAFAEGWIRDAQSRLAKLGDTPSFELGNPLKMTATPSNAGWMISFTAAEPTKKMEYRVDGGKWSPLEMYFSTPLSASTIRIEVRYEDPGGQIQGPFAFELDPRTELTAFGKGILQKMPTVWAAFGEDHNAGYLYFTTILVYRCALSRIEYGLGVSEPDRELELPRCDPTDPMAIPNDATIFMPVDPSLPFVSVRLTFADGDVSDVVRIDRKRVK
jgi:hypothetical protein